MVSRALILLELWGASAASCGITPVNLWDPCVVSTVLTCVDRSSSVDSRHQHLQAMQTASWEDVLLSRLSELSTISLADRPQMS